MDEKTFHQFRNLVVSGPAAREATPPNLTAEELHVYKVVVAAGLRLEQEKIRFEYAVRELQGAAKAGQ